MTKKWKQKHIIAVFMAALALGLCVGNPKSVTVKAATQSVGREAQMKADDSSWEYPVTAPTATWKGEGTESSPYQISTAQELANLSYMVNNGESYAGKYFILTTDISLNDEAIEFDAASGLVKVTDGTHTGYLGTGIAGTTLNKENPSKIGTWYVNTALVQGNYTGQLQEWVPIGILDETQTPVKQLAFEGTFDGNGKTVKGLYTNADKKYTALFSTIMNASVKNLTIDASCVYSSEQYTAVLIGMAEKSKVEDCVNKAAVFSSDSSQLTAAAGLISLAYGVEMDRCTNEGVVNGNMIIGGVIAYADNSNVKNTENLANVYANTEAAGIVADVHGVAGTSTLDGCKNQGNIYCDGLTGGIVGFASTAKSSNGTTPDISAHFIDCSNEGTIISNATPYVGGIGGQMRDADIEQCTNSGAIMVNAAAKTIYAGGVCGAILGTTISSCSNDAKLSAGSNMGIGGIVGYTDSKSTLEKNINEGKIEGGSYVAGIVGNNSGKVMEEQNWGVISGSGYTAGIAGKSIESIEKCENFGEIQGGEAYAGGIVALAVSVSVKDCVNNAEVKAKNAGGIAALNNIENGSSSFEMCFNSGTIEAERAGGILARNYKGEASIKNCANTGILSRRDSSATDVKIGGIIAFGDKNAKVTVMNSYSTGEIDLSKGSSDNTVAQGIAGDVAILDVTNCYYADAQESDSIDGTTFKTDAQFKSGEVAYLLNEAKSTGTLIWYQNIENNKDDAPVLDNTHGVVYQKKDGNLVSYYNTVSDGNQTPQIPQTPQAPAASSGLPAGTTITDPSTKANYKVTNEGTRAADGTISGATIAYAGSTNKKLTSVVIPSVIIKDGITYKVTSVGANAFKNNKKLKKVTIGSDITSIGVSSFYGCKNLKIITIKTTGLTMSSVGSKAFKGINPKAVIKVPKKSLKSYQKLLKKKGVSSKVTIKK